MTTLRSVILEMVLYQPADSEHCPGGWERTTVRISWTAASVAGPVPARAADVMLAECRSSEGSAHLLSIC